MTNKLFDSFVSDKLSNYESQVPEGLWEKIIAEEDKKPKVIFWWNNKMLLLGFALLLGASTVGYFAITNSPKKIDSNKLLTTENSLITPKKDVNPNSVLAENLTINSTQEAEENKLTKNIELDKNTTKSNINTDVLLKTNNGIVEGKFTKKIKTKNISEILFVKENIEKKGKTNESTLSNSDNLYQLNSNPNNSLFKRLNNEASTNNDAEFLNTLSLSKIRGKLMFADAKNLAANYQFQESKNLDLGKFFSGTDECPTTRDKTRNDIYLEGYISPDFAYKTVASTMNGNADYLQKKDSSESMQLGFTIGARFSKSITNNLLLKAGLQYSQMNEKFTLRTENDRRQTIVINSHTIVRTGLPDTTISDTSVFVQIGYRVRSNMNYYRNLEIPILLSYEFGQPEDKWRIAVNGGAILNITSWYDGKTIDAGYNVINIGSKSNSGFYKHQFGVSLYGGISIIRNINPTLDVFAEPYFRYGLNNLQSTSGFTQKFNVVGLQFGARIKINSNKHL